MAKKKKSTKSGFPKRIVGVRVPKGFRRFADSPVGAALLAEAIVGAAASIAQRPQVKSAASAAGEDIRHAGSSALTFAGRSMTALLAPVIAAARDVVDHAERYREQRAQLGDDRAPHRRQDEAGEAQQGAGKRPPPYGPEGAYGDGYGEEFDDRPRRPRRRADRPPTH